MLKFICLFGLMRKLVLTIKYADVMADRSGQEGQWFTRKRM